MVGVGQTVPDGTFVDSAAYGFGVRLRTMQVNPNLGFLDSPIGHFFPSGGQGEGFIVDPEFLIWMACGPRV